MKSDLALIKHHVEALFIHDEDGRLVKVNEPGGGPAPRFFLGRTKDGLIRRYRNDLDNGIVTELNALCDREDQTSLTTEPQYLKEIREIASRR